MMLQEAKGQCDYLIVGLQNNPNVDRPAKNVPIQSLVERMIQLKAVKYVDEIYVYNTERELLDLMQLLPIDVRILGEEYKNKLTFTGAEYCQNNNIELYFNKRNHGFSSTDIRNRLKA